jgi:hypothetical protein
VDLELNPGTEDFQVTGRVHSNGNIYCEPDQRQVTFHDHVTAAQQIVHDNHPDDPMNRAFGSVTYLGEHDSMVSTLNLSIGAANTSSNLHKIIEIPPPSELATSLMGQQRLYNRADLIILVNDGGLVARSGVGSGFLDVTSNVTSFVYASTNTFEDKRENRSILYTELDLAQFGAASLAAVLGTEPKILYIADQRSPGFNQQCGVRLINGQFLPTAGLTIATLNPLYVKGHFNAVDLGSTNTTLAKPAALFADAVTVLSGNWDDSNSGLSLASRQGVDLTINAAIVAGIVPSAGGYYSGGVENFIRLLEDWSPNSRTLTFNGSIAVLYYSQIATGSFGASGEVYSPPSRRYGFDGNFKNPGKLPPATPHLRTLIRGQWAVTHPNSVL